MIATGYRVKSLDPHRGIVGSPTDSKHRRIWNMKKLIVISLFDGISAGRVALERAGFTAENGYDVHYYA